MANITTPADLLDTAGMTGYPCVGVIEGARVATRRRCVLWHAPNKMLAVVRNRNGSWAQHDPARGAWERAARGARRSR